MHPSEPARLEIALVGAGKMGQQHAKAIRRLTGVAEVVAVVDPSAEAREAVLAVWPEAEPFDSLDAMLAGDSGDVVHVCTSPATHAPFARAALEAGRHVYVEKPFVEHGEEARELLELAASKGLSVCAGHQLLFERPTLEALELLPALRSVVHIESYFSFKTVRRAPGGRAPLAPQLQLLDILPHPVYLLLRFLNEASPEGEAVITAVDVGPAGTVHAQIRKGEISASLIVTLDGRPVDSYLKVVGTNGTVVADYVRGMTHRTIGPGVSGIDKALNPYRVARQLVFGTTKALGLRVLKKKKSYPGLAEIFGAFYAAVREGGESPTPPESVRDTVEICEQVAEALDDPGSARQRVAQEPGKPLVLVTGGTGFLGRRLCDQLVGTGANVRVIARRLPAPWEGLPGIDYVTGDLSQPLGPELFQGVDVVVHCAAETAGGWEQHERNSIQATENLLKAAAAAGVERFVQVSSIAVLAPPAGRGSVSEESPLHSDPRAAGPYTWGKLVSEERAIRLGEELGVRVKVWRPAALVDFDSFDPPGKLGKRLGNIFVAVGGPKEPLAAVDLTYSARMLAWSALDFESAPDTLNILAPSMPTRRELVDRLRASNPDLTVVWLPRLVLHPLSAMAVVAQRVLRPGRSAVSVAKVFARQRYDNAAAAAAAPDAEAALSRMAVQGPQRADSISVVPDDREPAGVE